MNFADELAAMLETFDKETRGLVLQSAMHLVAARQHLSPTERTLLFFTLGAYVMAYGLVILIVGGVSSKGIKDAFDAAFETAKRWINATQGRKRTAPMSKDVN